MMHPPKLSCPECGVALIPATDRGYYDGGGDFIRHPSRCQCQSCHWVWFDDTPPVECECGARVVVTIGDGYASVRIAKG